MLSVGVSGHLGEKEKRGEGKWEEMLVRFVVTSCNRVLVGAEGCHSNKHPSAYSCCSC